MGRKRDEEGSHCQLRESSKAKSQTHRSETLFQAQGEKSITRAGKLKALTAEATS